jgi:hypothetical protein
MKKSTQKPTIKKESKSGVAKNSITNSTQPVKKSTVVETVTAKQPSELLIVPKEVIIQNRKI